jgi:hypothetical protein
LNFPSTWRPTGSRPSCTQCTIRGDMLGVIKDKKELLARLKKIATETP